MEQMFWAKSGKKFNAKSKAFADLLERKGLAYRTRAMEAWWDPAEDLVQDEPEVVVPEVVEPEVAAEPEVEPKPKRTYRRRDLKADE